MRTLHLTTPAMHGPDVAVLQQLLIKHGRLGKDHTHGVYNKATADGAYRAKWHLGYAAARCDHTAGGHARLLPAGHAQAHVGHGRVAAQRAAEPKSAALRSAAVAYLRSHLGDRERSGHNDCFATDWWYGRRTDSRRDWGPWCMMGASAAYRACRQHALFRAGARLRELHGAARRRRPRPPRPCLCPRLRRRAPRRPHLLALPAREPLHEPGSGATTSRPARSDGLHGGQVLTIGCNTIPQNGAGDEANGGGVYERSRPVAQLYRVVRVGA